MDCVCISLSQLKEILSSFNGDSPIEHISPGPDTVLCYVYTGGLAGKRTKVALSGLLGINGFYGDELSIDHLTVALPRWHHTSQQVRGRYSWDAWQCFQI